MKTPILVIPSLALALASGCSSRTTTQPPPDLALPSNFADLLAGGLGGSAGSGIDLGALTGQLAGAGAGVSGQSTVAPSPAPLSEQKSIGSEKSAWAFAEKFGLASMHAMVDLEASKADALATADCNCREMLHTFIQNMHAASWHIKEFSGKTKSRHATRLAEGWRLDEVDDTDAVPMYDSSNRVVYTIAPKKDVKAHTTVMWINGEWKASEIGVDSVV